MEENGFFLVLLNTEVSWALLCKGDTWWPDILDKQSVFLKDIASGERWVINCVLLLQEVALSYLLKGWKCTEYTVV